ncbi:hypothetical protein [Brevibacillus laterosporus]|uniref:hypothetical protein n=1 Tax=Brevibacillus laterosporus TaxID=1465 RepID=UPI001C3EE395|nr:hypothetical protein [Brevibacillus laterosporus]
MKIRTITILIAFTYRENVNISNVTLHQCWREVSEKGGELLRGFASSFDTVMKQVRIEEENGDWTWVNFGNIASVTD